jgi:hypothetical protein
MASTLIEVQMKVSWHRENEITCRLKTLKCIKRRSDKTSGLDSMELGCAEQMDEARPCLFILNFGISPELCSQYQNVQSVAVAYHSIDGYQARPLQPAVG